MPQNPWDNDPVINLRDGLPVDEGRRPYRVVRRESTSETPTQLLNQGYRQEADGTWAKVVGTESLPAGDMPWANDPVVTDSQMRAGERAAEIVGTDATDDRENALLQGVTLGFAEELGGNLAGLGQAGRNLGRRLTGQPIEINSADLRDAVIEQTRGRNAAFRETNPFQSGAFELGGGLLSGGLAGAGRATLANTARVGFVTGGAYGAGAAEGGFADRLAPAALGAAVGAGAGVALQSVATPIAQRLGSIAQGSARASPRVNPVIERAQASRWAGIDPALAGVGGPVTQRVANTLSGNVTGAGPIAAAAARTREQTIGAVDRIAGQYGSAGGRDSAGQVLRRGAETGARELRREGGDLYQPINALELDPTPIPLANSRQALDESLSIFRTPELRDWFSRNATDLTDLNGVIQQADDGVTFAEARRLREVVGKMLKAPEIFNSRSSAGLNRLYGALSDDISQGAEQLGGSEAARALGRADRYWSAARDRADRVLEQFVGADNSSTAYQRLLEISRSTGRRSDWQQLRQLRDSIPADDWNEIGAGVIRSLGGEGEDFSVAKFVTEWDKMTPQARRVLFGGADRADQFRDLNNLARVLKDQKAAGRFYNFSESGNTLGNWGVAGSGATALGALGAGNPLPLVGFLTAAATANLGARALVSPGVARWLASPPNQVVPNAQRLAARNADFATFWNANREAIIRALQNPSTGPVGAFAGQQEEAPQ